MIVAQETLAQNVWEIIDMCEVINVTIRVRCRNRHNIVVLQLESILPCQVPELLVLSSASST